MFRRLAARFAEIKMLNSKRAAHPGLVPAGQVGHHAPVVRERKRGHPKVLDEAMHAVCGVPPTREGEDAVRRAVGRAVRRECTFERLVTPHGDGL